MKRFLAHVQIVLSGMILTLLCIDRVNDAMEMIDHPLTKWLLFALCGAGLVGGYLAVREGARLRARREQRAMKKQGRAVRPD